MSYIYKNKQDTARFNIFQQSGEWNLDVWTKSDTAHSGAEVWTYGAELGALFRTRREAKEWLVSNHGELISINPSNTVTNGW